MITIHGLAGKNINELMSQCPRMFHSVSYDNDGHSLVMLDDNVIMKTTGDADHVTIDLAGNLYTIKKTNFYCITIT